MRRSYSVTFADIERCVRPSPFTGVQKRYVTNEPANVGSATHSFLAVSKYSMPHLVNL